MKKNKQPLISVIMPVFNADKYLKDAIDSILNQTYSNFEFIIIDDSSTDNSWFIIKNYQKIDKRIVARKNRKNSGVAATLNKALKLCHGEYVARMDADDISLPKRFQIQLHYLKKHPEIVGVGTQVNIINNSNKITGKRYFPTTTNDCYQFLMITSPVQHPTLMVRTQAIKKYQYSANYKTAEDWDLYFKLVQNNQLNNIHETLYNYRQNFGSNGYKNIKKAFVLIFKIRLNAILKLNYHPSIKGLIITFLQAILVFSLPEKLVFNLFTLWRVKKLSFFENIQLPQLLPNNLRTSQPKLFDLANNQT
jgi:glycosyltransferase involved in cell wall biosynthesis